MTTLQKTPLVNLAITLVVIFLGLGCNSRPSVPEYYVSKPIISDRDRILAATPPANPEWTPAEIETLKDLWLGSLPPISPAPSNAVADNPQAAALGHKLFFDPRLSANQQVACATCHRPDLMFTDGFPVSFGTRTTRRNALSIVGAAYSPWLLWDGHKDSLWSQAIEPLEHPDEHGYTRLHAVHLIRQDETYRSLYEDVFGSLPDELADFDRFPDAGGPVEYGGYGANWESMSPEDRQVITQIYANLGKAIAAYERLLLPGPAGFDVYVRAVLQGDVGTMETALNSGEVAGLRLFIGPANCTRCHSGPLFTGHTFHNTGVPTAGELPPDDGRAGGVQRVVIDEFNCLGPYSDATPAACTSLRAVKTEGEALLSAFRTPALRNVTETAPYMHSGQFATLGEVLAHYNRAPPAPLGRTELKPLGLTESELTQLEEFLRSLSAPLASAPELLVPPEK